MEPRAKNVEHIGAKGKSRLPFIEAFVDVHREGRDAGVWFPITSAPDAM